MSQENVEIVRRLLVDDVDVAPLFRDDATWTAMMAEIEALYEPDCAVVWVAQGQPVIEATGFDEARKGWLNWLEPWATYHAQIERIFPADDKVVALIRPHGRMAATQNEVEMISASVYLVRDGRIARVEHYANRADALEAVGLRE